MELRTVFLFVFATCITCAFTNFIEEELFEEAAARRPSREYNTAWANLSAAKDGIYGAFSFVHRNNVTYIEGVIANLPNGEHGLHIHSNGNLRDNCAHVGDHYNPFNRSHSCDAATGHLGDLGNVNSVNGIALVKKEVTGMILAWSNGKEGNGNPGVLGLPIVVDTLRDTCDAKTDGASGPPLACGNIYPFIQRHRCRS